MNSNRKSELKWIIEEFSPDNGWDKLADEITKQGMECQVVKTNEFPIKFDVDKFSVNDKVLIQSSFQFAQELLHHKQFRPGTLVTPRNYKCTHYYKYFNGFLFNNEYIIETVCGTKNQINFIEKIIGEKETGRIFIRPDSGLKPFTGMVFINRDPYFRNDWTYVTTSLSDEELLIISSPKSIISEWRFVVINGEVVTGSRYKLDYDVDFLQADLIKHKDLFELAQKMADIYQPDLAFTLDLVEDEKNNFKLLELNSFSCAGLYLSDFEKIVKKISSISF